MKNDTCLKVITRGGTSASGKARVYISYHPSDFSCLDHIAKLILKKQDCAIYYYDYSNGDPDTDALRLLLNDMQLFVFPVTENFLCDSCNSFDYEFNYAKERFIAILPLMQNERLTGLFNQRCGNLHYLDEYTKDKTTIDFDEKLERFLSRVLVSSDTAERVHNEFDAHIFLSYRKKDREKANELIQLIHSMPVCRDIAIWYDEFLVVGEPFDKEIESKLRSSDLFALLVTPNIINEYNYVMSTEYPIAKSAGMSILPIESEETNHTILEEKFLGIPACIKVKDCETIANEIVCRIKTNSTDIKDTPKHNYLIGAAYLMGLDVERNVKYAISLISKAAQSGYPEAMKKLSDMYYSGVGVERNHKQAIEWQKLYVEYLNTASTCSKRSEIENTTLFWERNTLGYYYIEAQEYNNAEKTFKENCYLAHRLVEISFYRYGMLLALSAFHLGNCYLSKDEFHRAFVSYCKSASTLGKLAGSDMQITCLDNK